MSTTPIIKSSRPKSPTGERLAQAQEEMKSRWTEKLRRFETLADGPEKAALAAELFGSWSNEAKIAQKAAQKQGRAKPDGQDGAERIGVTGILK